MFKTAMTPILAGQANVPISPPTEIYLAKSTEVVPDVADLTMVNARTLLNSLGLLVTGPDTGTAGLTSPPAGTAIKPGATVTVLQYSGPPS
jgi:beta-lactam-binding protein with PASTA domain